MSASDDVVSADDEVTHAHEHSVWMHIIRAGAKLADAVVDVAAIAGVTLMAVQGVETATLQVVGGMIISVALGKRYIERESQYDR